MKLAFPRRARWLAAANSLILAGCGGGGGEAAPPAPPPPPPALTVQAAADEYTINADATARLAVQENDKVENAAGVNPVLTVIEAPKNGTAEADGAALSYRPLAGYFGEDSLRYRLSVGAVTSDAVVKLKVEGSLQLQGVTRPQALAGAQVEVRVGSRTYTTTADAQGEFLVSVRALPQDMVILKATGQGSQSAGVYTSIAGEIGRVDGAASGATITPTQWPNLRLTPSSTTWAALLVRQGKTPASQAELMAMSQAIPIDDFIDAGWPVYRFVDLGRLIYRESTWTSIPAYFSAPEFPQFLDEKRADSGITHAFGLSEPVRVEGQAPPVPGDRPIRLVYAQGIGGATSQALMFTLEAGGRASFTSNGKLRGAS